MKKTITRILSILLLVAIAIGCCACGAKTPAKENSTTEGVTATTEKFKIGILEVALNDESVSRAKWFNDYIAPQYNCEFMFSEACTTLDAAIAFIENAADAGCDAIINYAVGGSTEQLILLCKEYDMVYVENGGRYPGNEVCFTNPMENFAGTFMADQPATGKLFHDYLVENLDTTKEYGFVIGTGGAYQGNLQQIEISTGMLEALEELYGLTFDSTIEELITASSPIEATNDKGVPVYCYPGVPSAPGWLEGLSAALQTGEYNYLLMSAGVLGNIGTMVGETETALNKDISIVGFGSFGEALTSGMNTKDIFGNQTVNMSTVKLTSIVSAMAFAKVYNHLTGNASANLDENGTPSVLLFTMNAVSSPEQLATMSGWDVDGAWVADYDFVDSMLGIKNEGLTSEQIQDSIYAMNYDAIKARLG